MFQHNIQFQIVLSSSSPILTNRKQIAIPCRGATQRYEVINKFGQILIEIPRHNSMNIPFVKKSFSVCFGWDYVLSIWWKKPPAYINWKPACMDALHEIFGFIFIGIFHPHFVFSLSVSFYFAFFVLVNSTKCYLIKIYSGMERCDPSMMLIFWFNFRELNSEKY